jgi:cytochrome b6-f complex iron-sulfur subunit
MKRRSFLTILTTALGLTALGSLAYPLFRFLLPIESSLKAKSVILPLSQLPVDTTKDIMIGLTPAIVLNIRGKGYLAFSRVCTHLGCLVKYHRERQEFICPCHAGTFDLDGNVLSGPPPKPLPKFAVKIEGSNLVIG